MNKNLDRIEAHLRTIFEQSLPKFFTGNQANLTMIEDLMCVMRNELRPGVDGEIYAPDQFVLEVPPNDLSEWQIHQDILDKMADSIHTIGEKEGFTFINPPRISIKSNPKSNNHNIIINAVVTKPQHKLPDTAAMPQSESDSNLDSSPENALLVIGGKTNFSLEKPVINIGRHSQNDLVLDDLHVSRHHAQLRAINKHYVVFDVGSTGGIFLNERQVSQATLQTGDVIRIGMVNLIYIEDSTDGYATKAVSAETDFDPPGDML